MRQVVEHTQPRCYELTSAHGHWVPYGYEYNGQAPLFDASLACDRIAYGILTAVSASGGICVLNQDARKNQLKSMCFIFGRPIFFVAAGIQDNFGEALVGSVITNTWIYVRYLCEVVSNISVKKIWNDFLETLCLSKY